MKKTKKLLSLLTAVALTASSFAALTVPASAAEKYKLDLTGATAGQITMKAPDGANDETVATYSVADFGEAATATTKQVTQLDGWGYKHYGLSNNITDGHQALAGINVEDNYVYVTTVGNKGTNAALSFIPKNVENLSLATSGVLEYKFDAASVLTGGSNVGTFTYGFTSADDGTTVTDVGSTQLSSDITTKTAMIMVYDLDNSQYHIFKDGIRVATGSVTTPITGIFVQAKSEAYAEGRIGDLVLSEEEAAPATGTVTFKKEGGTEDYKSYTALDGATIPVPTPDVVEGKTFTGWVKNSEGEAQKLENVTAAAGSNDVYVATYKEGSDRSNITIKSTAFTKVELTQTAKAEDLEDSTLTQAAITGYTDATGTFSANQIVRGTYSYKLTKTGYTSKEGTIELGTTTTEKTDTLELDDEHTKYAYFETDWINGTGSISCNAVDRTVNTNLAAADVVLPATGGNVDIFTVHVTAKYTKGTRANSVGTWILKTEKSGSAGLLGLQWTQGDGAYAFTDWKGNENPQDAADAIDKATNKIKILEDAAIDTQINIDFVVNPTAKSITVNYNGDTIGSLPIPEANDGFTALQSMTLGSYREVTSVTIDELSVEKPDPNFLAINGDTKFAKIAGQTVTREYTKSETVVNEEEEFTWTVKDTQGQDVTGVTIEDGVLSVTEAATPGDVVITCTSTTNDKKTATLTVTIADFQKPVIEADGPMAYVNKANAKGQYSVVSAVDSFGTEYKDLFDAKWTSSTPAVATIDEETGELTVVGKGETTITVSITNGTINGEPNVATAEIPVVVGDFYITGDVEGSAASTEVDLKDIAVADKYLVTTADASGNQVKQTEIDLNATKTIAADAGVKITATYADGTLTDVSAPVDVAVGTEIDLTPADANTKVFFWKSLASMEPAKTKTEKVYDGTKINIDTTDAAKYEVAPIFEADTIGAGDERYTFAIPADTYNFTVTMSGRRADIYSNDQLLINNMLQYGSKATDVVNDIVVSEGYAKMHTMDYEKNATAVTSVVEAIEVVKSPSIVTRKTKMYVLGDSLVAKYYNGGSAENNLQQTGWGQVLQDYITDDIEVVNLANSGVTAPGLYGSAFTQIQQSAKDGDYFVLESGYNDKTYETEDKMKTAVRNMVDESLAKNMKLILVSPNASQHDYSASVAWTSYMKQVADEYMGAGEKHSDNVDYIDLSAISYKFLHDKYGDPYGADGDPTVDKAQLNDLSKIYNVSDVLHSTYNAANCWAAVIAQNIKAIWGDHMVKVDHTYTFKDGNNEDITVGVGKMPTLDGE